MPGGRPGAVQVSSAGFSSSTSGPWPSSRTCRYGVSHSRCSRTIGPSLKKISLPPGRPHGAQVRSMWMSSPAGSSVRSWASSTESAAVAAVWRVVTIASICRTTRSQGVLAGRDVAGIDAAQPEGFQMAHQGAVTATRLGERANAAQIRDQRQHRRARRRVEVARSALEAGSLAHHPASTVEGVRVS